MTASVIYIMIMKTSNKIKRIIVSICLLFLVGILCIYPEIPVQAAEVVQEGIGSRLTDTTDDRTNIREPGASDDTDELKELNIANTVTVTYDNGNGEINGALRILITLTLIAIAPILIILMTSFTRIVIVMHFTRNALNTQTAPPNQIIIGLSLFLTFFIMSPTINTIRTEALAPFDAGEIDQAEALDRAMKPMRDFMYPQTQLKDVRMFLDIAHIEWTEEDGVDAIPNSVLIPSFILSELRTAFIIGFMIYVPFIVIDMVVASALMSMGMMMLPPTTISMPFKILLFVLADGWNLVIGNVVRTFY